MPTLSRRQLLLRGGALAGTLTLARIPLPASAASTTLSPARRESYRRLVGAMAASPDRRARHVSAGRAAREFSQWYSEQGPELRAHADAVLDGLAGTWDGSCRALASPSRPDRAALAASALALGARTTEPAPMDEDDRTPAPALAA